ncbi:hypothetical protein [Microbacterium sp. PA5]|uniref:hypothetical protein n=1 Tax=Microbacterium sp. PA5 TaxID=3416654 RepID=UPI003CF41A01
MPIEAEDPFASPTLMEQRSQGAITTTTHPYLPSELNAATQDIRDFCRWHIAPRKQLTHHQRGPFVEHVWLPAMQIQSIDEVTADGTVWTEDQVAAIEFNPDTGWTSLCGRYVTVKYTAGFEEVPANIETLTLELAATALGTSLGYAREQAGSVSVTFARAGGGIDDGSAPARRLAAYQIGRLP